MKIYNTTTKCFKHILPNRSQTVNEIRKQFWSLPTSASKRLSIHCITSPQNGYSTILPSALSYIINTMVSTQTWRKRWQTPLSGSNLGHFTWHADCSSFQAFVLQHKLFTRTCHQLVDQRSVHNYTVFTSKIETLGFICCYTMLFKIISDCGKIKIHVFQWFVPFLVYDSSQSFISFSFQFTQYIPHDTHRRPMSVIVTCIVKHIPLCFPFNFHTISFQLVIVEFWRVTAMISGIIQKLLSQGCRQNATEWF